MKNVLTYLAARIQSVSPSAQPIFLGAFAAAILMTLLAPGGLILGPALLAFMVMIYADPAREVPTGSGLVLSPIDGYITDTIDNVGLPLQFDQNKTQTDEFIKMGFRLSFRGCRTVRAPITGTVREILRLTPEPDGMDTLSAWTQMDSIALLITDPNDREFALVLSGVLIPEQIRVTVKVGDSVTAGDRLGIVLFFATGALYVPNTTPLLRTRSHHLMAGETVVQAASFPYAPLFHTI